MNVLILLVSVVVLVFALVLREYLIARKASNARLRDAVEQFHAAANKLLRTPEDLPDELLTAIGAMSRLAFSRKAPHYLRTYVRTLGDREQSGNYGGADGEHLGNTLRSLRPELQVIIKDLARSWLSMVINNNVLLRLLIRRELDRLQKQKTRSKKRENEPAVGQMEVPVSERLLSLLLGKDNSLSLFLPSGDTQFFWKQSH